MNMTVESVRERTDKEKPIETGKDHPAEKKAHHPFALPNDQIILLPDELKSTLEALIAAGKAGVPRKKLEEPYLNRGMLLNSVATRVSKDLAALKGLFEETYQITNRTPPSRYSKGEKAIYVLEQKAPSATKSPSPRKHRPTDIAVLPTTSIKTPNLTDRGHFGEPRIIKTQENWHHPPKVELAIKATFLVLSSLLGGSLSKYISIRMLLDKANGAIMGASYSQDSKYQKLTIDDLFDASRYEKPSEIENPFENSLNRFFRINFTAILEDVWNSKVSLNTNIKPTREQDAQAKEKQAIQGICRELETKRYDIKGVVNEVFSHFGLKVPPEYSL